MAKGKSRHERGLYWDRAWSCVGGCTPVPADLQIREYPDPEVDW